jgi:hypothetical protein
MGALSFWGGVAGAGRGISGIGEQMGREDARRAQIEEQQQFQREMREEQRAAEVEREQRRAAAGPDRASARPSAGGGMSLADLAGRPDLLTLSGGGTMDRAAVDDALALAEGRTPMRQLQDDGSGFSATEAPKYTPGEASSLLAKAKNALWEAVKGGNPDKADDLSKSQRTDQGTRFAEEYRATGDERAGSAAMISGEKPAFDDGSSVASGRVAKGSLAEAKVGTERAKQGAEGALARKRGEETKTEVDKREGKGSIKEEISVLQQRRLGAEKLMADARKALTESVKMGNEADAEMDRVTIKAAQASLSAIDSQLTGLTTRLQEKAGAQKAPASGGEAAALTDAKRALAKNPGMRAEIERRLKAAGYSTKDL